MDNREQQRAISHGDGPLLVLAGPGSGKTFVLTRHIRYLIRNHHVPPQQILVITFTRASALEMKSRFFRLMEGGFYPVSFGTFHAFFLQILREYFHYRDFNVMPGRERNEFIRRYLGGFGNRDDAEAEAELNLYCNTLQRSGGKKGDADYDFDRFLKEYRSYCLRVKKLDFDDMANLLYAHLMKSPEILSALRERFRYILIDEFQDINYSQYRLIRLLTAPRNNLFLVGDDDQSIYAFRGSDPGIMLSFGQEFPGAETICLRINYRSDRAIVRSAGILIKDNAKRFIKQTEAFSDAPGEVLLVPCRGRAGEEEGLLRELARLLAEDSLDNAAVILRNNRQLEILAARLKREKIPFRKKEKLKSFFEMTEIRPLMAMLRFAAGPPLRRDLLQFANLPPRGIRREALMTERIDPRELLMAHGDSPETMENIRMLMGTMDFIRSRAPMPALRYLLKAAGYERHLELLARREGVPASEKTALAEELVDRSRGFSSIPDFLLYVREYDASLETREEGAGGEKGVWLYTMHGSKGLEFDTVFLPELTDNVIPGSMTLGRAEVEEERRLLYVAMTRARHRLIMSYTEDEAQGLRPSFFLEKLKGFRDPAHSAGDGRR